MTQPDAQPKTVEALGLGREGQGTGEPNRILEDAD